jgi:cyanate permease
MIGLWAGSVYAPSAVTQVALRQGDDAHQSARIASWATMLLSCGTILGCLSMPIAANRAGHRGALAVFFALMAASIATGFGYAFYLPHAPLRFFIPCLFLVGVGGANLSVYLVWIPEQYRSECRGSALALATCIVRFMAAGATFLVGAGISRYGSIGAPVAPTSLAFVLGLFVIPFSVETKGVPLPV